MAFDSEVKNKKEKRKKKKSKKADTGVEDSSFLNLSKILDGGMVVSVSIGLLFAIGSAYYAGYTRYWGLDEDNFPLSFPSMLYQGFLALFKISALNFSAFLILCMYAVITLVMIIVSFGPDSMEFGPLKLFRKLFDRKKDKSESTNPSKYKDRSEYKDKNESEKLKSESNKNKEESNKTYSADDDLPEYKETAKVIAYSFSKWVSSFIVGLLAIGVLFFLAEKNGQQWAEYHHKLLNGGNFKLIYSMNDGNSASTDRFFKIACNDKECAVYWLESETVQFLDRSALIGASRKFKFPIEGIDKEVNGERDFGN